MQIDELDAGLANCMEVSYIHCSLSSNFYTQKVTVEPSWLSVAIFYSTLQQYYICIMSPIKVMIVDSN